MTSGTLKHRGDRARYDAAPCPMELFVPMRFYRFVLAAALMAAGSPLHAADAATDLKVASIVESRVKDPNQSKSILKRLSDAQKDELIRQQAIIDGLLAAGSDPQAMQERDQQALANATKAIDGIVQDDVSAAEETRVCRRERKVGSNFSTRVCRTKAQMDADREQAREEAERTQFKSR